MNHSVISIVVPVFNEADILRDSLSKIQHYANITGLEYEIIIVDDGSTDDTWNIINSLSDKHKEIRGIKLSRNFGKESAITVGLEFASGSSVIVMDGDGQHPPELIPEMVKLWKEGKADIVEAVKIDRGNEGLSRAMGARLFYWLMKHLTGLDLDSSSDFKLLDRRVVDAHNRLPESSRFFRGIVSWLGFRKAQVTFEVKGRRAGRSKWSLLQLAKLAVSASTAFTSLPLHLVTVMGLVTFIFSIILGLQTLYMKFSGHAVSGFTTVILLLLFTGSVLMISLGVIGIYISRIYEEVKRRPKFIVEDTTNPVLRPKNINN